MPSRGDQSLCAQPSQGAADRDPGDAQQLGERLMGGERGFPVPGRGFKEPQGEPGLAGKCGQGREFRLPRAYLGGERTQNVPPYGP
ncbi:hypothetical protein GCM10009801_02140 [Streptomyces albiaxialis]|uniref:Uncharacterized protein n=1 Tax=Streptomyces albiaxialis TaxID=329523 RepID=A0ABN2VGA2_9ACTN